MVWSGSLADPKPMRWWGWGDPAAAPTLPAHALGFLREEVGIAEQPRPPVALAAVALPATRLDQTVLASMRAIVGAEGVHDDHAERVLHAAGKGYPDLVRLRAGAPAGAPDVVVYPRSHDQVRAILECCARESVAVVPFGGGTSVVGGLEPISGEHAAVLSLDMGRLDGEIVLDRESLTVQAAAGMRVPELERRLAERGLTLGHFPQSFEHVSLGGCAATRSAGQASSGYGRFEQMVLGLSLAAPSGDISLPAMPASAAGPSVRQLLVGSEGTLGVITGLALHVRPAPPHKRYEGVFFEDFQSGVQALRTLAQEHVAPTVARLSDEQETRLSLALAPSGGVKGRLGRLYLGVRGYRSGCLAILGFEGEQDELKARRARALDVVRREGGLAVGESPGQAWLAGRFRGPYLRDDLLTQGVMVETLETATPWANLRRLHADVGRAISDALSEQGTPGLVMCHVSHIYESGASLYFTFLARQREGAEIEQWQAVKRAAGDAIIAGGGTITHHHAVGRDHLPWMRSEIGERSLAALRAVKAELDPTGIMNPAKLLSQG
jgi:alkyldihydroxyacetonephosphate synthase